MAPHGVYPTAQPDRWLTLAIRDDAQWRALARVLGQDGNDARYATASARLEQRTDVDRLVTRWLASRDAESTAEQLQQAGVCAHVSWTMQDIASDPHLQARGAVTTVQAPGIPARLAVGAPARFSGTDQVGIRRLTPALGQDEDYVFGELLGLDSAQRADLQARGVIL
ncbi:Succinyl-CoA:(R)-benzylsuccinate CoA-transferase subunit BbsF [compost metagenome]